MRNIARALYRHIKPFYLRYRFATARSVLRLDFHGDQMGFFAQIYACVVFFRFADRRGLTPLVRLTGVNYLDSELGDDWLSYFFDQPALDKLTPAQIARAGRPIRIRNSDEIPRTQGPFSLNDAQEVFSRHLRTKPEIVAMVDDFCERHSIGSSSVGIHYRGTDKGAEAELTSHEDTFAVISSYLSQRGDAPSIFVASDEQLFIDTLRARFPRFNLVTYADSARSTDGQPVYQGARRAGNYLLGLDALMNALLLSRCGSVIRSTSFLSAWASVLNPDLSVVLLNRPFQNTLWFPESEIVKTAIWGPDLVASPAQ